MNAFETALAKLIKDSEKKLGEAIRNEDFATALTTRAFLSALSIVQTMYQIEKEMENRNKSTVLRCENCGEPIATHPSTCGSESSTLPHDKD